MGELRVETIRQHERWPEQFPDRESVAASLLVEVTRPDESTYEFVINWHEFTAVLSERGKLSARVCLFDDAWAAFEDLAAFFAWLAGWHRARVPLAEVEKFLQTEYAALDVSGRPR